MQLIAPMLGVGLGIGLVDSSMMPELAYLVDTRHTAVYGTVYAIGDTAFCTGFALGPLLSGVMMEKVGFKTMLMIFGIASFVYCPLLFFLWRGHINVKGDGEETLLLKRSSSQNNNDK